jgi:hypothetical protein
MGLAVDQLIQANTDHILTLDLLELDADTVTEALYTLVPVSERRRHMSGVWLLLASQAGADPEFAEVLHRLNESVAEGVSELLGAMSHQGLLHASRDIATETRRLHALIDGLSLQCMTDPALRSEADVRAILRAEVAALSEPSGARVG